MSTHSPLPTPRIYGTYAYGELPPGTVMVPTDGTIRIIRRLGLPFGRVMQRPGYDSDDRGNIVYVARPRMRGYAILAEHLDQVQAAIAARQPRAVTPHPDVLLCTREASRAAHTARNKAAAAYGRRDHRNASAWREKKDAWYARKERGIVHLHRAGVLRYAGVSPQGMAVYEYGEGGMQCLHSTLHPRGAERKPIATPHPELLYVPARDKARGVSLDRIRVTLEALPGEWAADYERSGAPRIRREIVCYACGEPGHIAAECPEEYDYERA